MEDRHTSNRLFERLKDVMNVDDAVLLDRAVPYGDVPRAIRRRYEQVASQFPADTVEPVLLAARGQVSGIRKRLAGYYMPATRVVTVPGDSPGRSPAVVAHELGHAAVFNPADKSKWGLYDHAQHLNAGLYAPSKLLSSISGVGTSILGSIIASRTGGAVKPNLLAVMGAAGVAGGGVGTALGAPMIINEAEASRRAVKALKETGALRDGDVGALAGAFATYPASTFLAGAGPAALAAALTNSHFDRRPEVRAIRAVLSRGR